MPTKDQLPSLVPSRNAKAVWIGVIVLIILLLGAAVPVLHRFGFYFGGSHLEAVDIDEGNISAGETTSSGVPAPLKDGLVVGDSGTYEPKFPYRDFFQVRKSARADSFQIVIKQKLPDGPCCIAISNSRSKILLPLEKRAEGLYVSSPFLILNPSVNPTYFYGYGILRQEPGTADSISIEVNKVIPNWK